MEELSEETEQIVGIRTGIRYVAAMIDNIAAIFFSISVFSIIGVNSVWWVNTILICSYFLSYFFIMEAIWSRTLGKMICKLTVIQENEENITIWQAFIRTILRVFEVNPFLGFAPAFICIIATTRRQRIGDMLARTIVTYK